MKTVAEYAAENGISTTTVYKRVSKGVLKGFKRDGITYIVEFDEDASNPTSNHASNPLKGVSNPVGSSAFIDELFSIIKDQGKEIKALRKEVKRLTKKLEQSEAQGKEIMLNYIHELKELRALPLETEIVEDPPKKKKKKKKKH